MCQPCLCRSVFCTKRNPIARTLRHYGSCLVSSLALCSPTQAVGVWCCADVYSFALLADEAEELDGSGAGGLSRQQRDGQPTYGFDKDYWEQHWHRGRDGGPGSMRSSPPNPHLAREIGGLQPGTVLDAGCGAGGEAIWLASTGWQVTAADISSEALARAAERATTSGVADRVGWVETDLGSWDPARSSTWSPRTTRTRRCRSWSSTTGSPHGSSLAAPC